MNFAICMACGWHEPGGLSHGDGSSGLFPAIGTGTLAVLSHGDTFDIGFFRFVDVCMRNNKS